VIFRTFCHPSSHPALSLYCSPAPPAPPPSPTRRSSDLISRVLTLADMAEEPFADFPAGSPGRLQSDLAFRAAGLARDVRYEAATPGLIVDVVAAGLAVALLPQTFAR